MPFLNEQRRGTGSDSLPSPIWNSASKPPRSYTTGPGFKSSLQNIFKNRKRKRESTSPSPPALSIRTSSESSTKNTANLDQLQVKTALPISPTTCRLGRRRASTRCRETLPPVDFTSSELKKPVALPRCCCVSQQKPEPGFRVTRKARSAEKCFVTTLPLYSAKNHSPMITHKISTTYFEARIRSGNEDGEVGLALGFVAGKARAWRMPGFEKGTIGIQCRDGRFYLNGKFMEDLSTREFEQYQRVGIGITFSSSGEDPLVTTTSTFVTGVEVFVTRDGKMVKRLNLHEQAEHSDVPLFEGLGGSHDLYAAVGTTGQVSADILFEQDDWKYVPKAP